MIQTLLNIKKNVKNILIPSEEHKIRVYPMDYEEFLWATGGNPNVLNMAYKLEGTMDYKQMIVGDDDV